MKKIPTSTVGRGRSKTLTPISEKTIYKTDEISAHFGDSLDFYDKWKAPNVIISDGAYGILWFEGDTSDHLWLPDWYEPHIKAWSKASMPGTTLWFWNSEIGWAAVHPILEKYGWRYVSANIWDKGKAHVAWNVNTAKIRRFPVVSEICVQYVREPRINGMAMKEWLLKEWKRTGLPVCRANEACWVKDAAVRRYLDQSHLWYFPPPEKFEMITSYANRFGKPSWAPYYSIDWISVVSWKEWASMRSKFNCPHWVTNIWSRPPLKDQERVKVDWKAVHLNQKPLDLMSRLIEASSDEWDVIWEPFGWLMSATVAANSLWRRWYTAEIDETYFSYWIQRFSLT